MHEEDRKSILKQATLSGLKTRMRIQLGRLGAMSSHEKISQDSDRKDVVDFLKSMVGTVKALNNTALLLKDELTDG